MKNLLVICDIPDANLFLTSVNSDTLPLIYNKEALLDILIDNKFERIGIAFEKKELFDVDFRLFNVKHIDFLACDTLKDPIWCNYYKTLQDAGITIGASDNKTGNLKYGGDWVMESTSEDIEKVYFSGGIEYYKYLLGPTSDFMFVMKSDGLYGSGNNTSGQLGGNTRVSTNFIEATSVACGWQHMVAIKAGILYGCGDGSQGKLGSAGYSQVVELRLMSGLTGFTAVSCGDIHTVAIKDGILYGCGYNEFGQLGSAGTLYNKINILTKMSGITGCTAVSCGQYHTVAIKDGILYGCGDGSYGKLGSAGSTGTLSRMSELTGFTAVSCGGSHTVAIKDGILYGCGLSDFGQLGSAGTTGTLTPMSGITGFTAVSCGQNHTVAIKDGLLYGCGSNNANKLGYSFGNQYLVVNKLIFPTVETLIAVSCGYDYTVVLTSNGNLYGAGSNANRLLKDTSDSKYSSFTFIDSNVLNINDSGKLTTYLKFTTPYINKPTTLSASSNSPSVITFSSTNSNLSITGSTGSIATPRTRGIATIIASQGETGNFLGATVTCSVQVYYNNLGFTGLPSMINKETTLSVTSDSTGAISYTSNSVLSVTGSGTNCIVTPLKTGTGYIVVYQAPNEIFLGATVTGTVQVYFANLGFTGFPSIINKENKLSVISDSPGSIIYSTNSVLSVTGSGKNFTVTPLQTGTGTIVVIQGETGNFLGATVTGSVQVYYNNLGFTGFQSMINKETTLFVTSDSTGAISYTSNSILSVTGSGTSCTVTPLQTGTGTIVATQLENGNYFSRTVTGSVQVYFSNLGFTGLPSFINKETTLNVTSYSPGAISYSSNSVLSVTGSGTSCTVTPLQTGTGTIVVTQGATGNFLEATITGSVQVYVTNLGFTGFPSFINKKTTLSVTSDSSGSISYSSNSVLSVTGTGKSFTVTPLQTGTGTIVVTQGATGNYFSKTVTGSVQVYFANLGFTGFPSMINKETTLYVTSESPGAISYSSNLFLRVTGSEKSFTVTPLETGNGTIVVTQGATGNFSEATVTGSMYVSIDFRFIDNDNIQPIYITIPLSNYFSGLRNYNRVTFNSNYICIVYENYIIIYNSNNTIYKKILYRYLNITSSDIKDVLFINNNLYIATNNNIYNFDISSYPQLSNIMSLT